MLSKHCTKYALKFEKIQQWPQICCGHFHSNPKEKQCQKCSKYCTVALISHVSKVMLKILQAKLQKYMTKGFKSTWPRTSRPSSQILKRQRNQRSNCQYLLNHNKSKRIPEKTSTSASLLFDCVDHNRLYKILQEMGIPDELTSFLRHLYAGQGAKIRTRYSKTDWFQIAKGVHQGCILSSSLFNLYAEYFMWEMPGWMKHGLDRDCWEKYQ